MKKTAISILLFYFFVVSTKLFSQSAININGNYSNVYDFTNQYFNSPTYQPSNHEGGADEYIKKTLKLWSNSLHPSGNFSIAAQAITDYANNYSFSSSSYSPNWIELGPFEDPNTPSGGSSGVGQIHRLEFDPNYDGITNQTIYAGTGYGGLWKTIDNGLNWTSMNTDVQLPIASVSGIVINPSNPSNIFISTGDGDGGFGLRFSNNHGFPNPVSTVGVYRTTDDGQNWESINNGLLSNFALSGIIREIRMNPSDPDEIILASSAGVIKTINATSTTPTWTVEYTGIDPLNPDQQFRGIEYKPGDPNTIYASGTDIYKFDGVIWASMTGFNTGLDFTTFIDGFVPERINIAVTPADPDKLYAYIFGTIDCPPNKCNKIFIYVFKNGLWTKLHEYQVPYNATHLINRSMLAITASQTNPNEFYFGGAPIFGTADYNNTSTPIHDISGYNSNGIHADVHALRLQPNLPGLFAGTDGGVSFNPDAVTASNSNGWQRRYKGLAVSLIWTFDNSEFDSRKIIGKQDLGVSIFKPTTNNWETITGGDGYGVRIDDEYPDEVYYRGNFPFQKYNFFSGSIYQWENNYLPTDFFEQSSTNVNQIFPMVNHPETGELWFGFSELYKRKKREIVSGDVSTDIWEVKSENYTIPNHSAKWQRGISELVIAESNPDYIYLATIAIDGGGQIGGLDLDPLLLRTTNGNQTVTSFDNITPNLPQTYVGGIAYPVITGIAVNPSDEEELWVTFAGYNPTLKVWHSTNAGDTWTNYDPNGDLPNLSTNVIVYQDGTDGVLYLGTDVGVYVKEGVNGSWEKYGDFPNVRVTEMKINGCSGKLDVATYGRGLWEGDLLPSGVFSGGRVINGTVTWSGDKSVKSNIIIPNGSILTITGVLNMPKNGKIIVEQGGKLIVNGGTITNQCGQLWNGIEVQGDMNASQITTGAQGYLEIKNNATIENAKVAVHASKQDANGNVVWGTFGGIIKVTNSTFKNNGHGIDFGPYQNFIPNNPSTKIKDKSVITNSTFTWEDNSNLISLGHQPYSHIGMWRNHGIRIYGNDFKNEASYTTYSGMNRGLGLVTFDSEYSVLSTCSNIAYPCTSFDNNNFINLTYGIKASASNPFNTLVVKSANFVNCQRGILLKGIDYASLTKNTFDVASPVSSVWNDNTYGIYLDNCNGYEIEENTITTSVASPPNIIPTYGIYILNSGQVDNEIYKNTAENVNVGLQSSNINGNSDQFNPKGLEFRCNELNNLANSSIAITDILYRPFQGSCSSSGSPANNSFDYSSAYDIWTNPSIPFIGYRYSSDPGNIYGLAPRNPPNTNNNLFPQDCNLLPSYNQATSCPSHIRQPVIAILNTFSTLRTAATTTGGAIDGGNTVNLLSTITNAPDYQIRNELMNASPYLSNKVLLSMLDKTPAISTWVIEQVLAANAPLSDEVFAAMLARTPTLPDYLIRNMAMESSPLSTKEQLALISRSPTLPAWIINQVMIENSPLFDEVLYALMDRFPNIPNWSIRNVFMRNTPLSEGVQYALNNHSPTYPNWVKNGINKSPFVAGEALEEPQPSSPLMEVSQEVAELNRQATLTKNELFRTYLHDTTGTYGVNDVISFIKNQSTCTTKDHLELTKAHIRNGQLTKAQTKIDSLIQDTSLAIFCELNTTIIDLKQSNTTLNTNSTAKQSTEVIAQSTTVTKEKSAAEAMLAFEQFLTYQEVFEPLAFVASSNRLAPPNTVELTNENYTFDVISVYPNPANGDFTVSYNLNTNKDAVFKLYDIAGKEVMQFKIANVVGEMKLSTRELNSGVYFYSVSMDDAIIMQDKLIITKH